MLKNKIFDKTSKKDKKLKKKYQKILDEFNTLDAKFQSGDITQNELVRYNQLDAELESMNGKFKIENGKIVFNDASEKGDDTKNDESEQQATETPEQEQTTKQSDVTDDNGEGDDTMPEQNETVKTEQNDEQKKEFEEKQTIKEELEKQRQQQKQAEQQQQQDNQSDDKLLSIRLFVRDLPDLKIGIKQANVKDFAKSFDKAQRESSLFYFGDFVIAGDKLIAFRIESYSEEKNE